MHRKSSGKCNLSSEVRLLFFVIVVFTKWWISCSGLFKELIHYSVNLYLRNFTVIYSFLDLYVKKNIWCWMIHKLFHTLSFCHTHTHYLSHTRTLSLSHSLWQTHTISLLSTTHIHTHTLVIQVSTSKPTAVATLLFIRVRSSSSDGERGRGQLCRRKSKGHVGMHFGPSLDGYTFGSKNRR